ncbi:Outer membrane scaffolding protein for murein synthesis, MipA/OmpV family [Arsukibacterium tuosuense]|uniref:Outer membrane scaffolding protein for murein synthesis, MipA/OmpV family n=1 Tax=Arsukibacterium tuosuense TaxID=1323745 RepID=A0A285IPS1_9GAMM|nr:MipA/OmpV family protein [Arsukibacterium tuosuense]SNY49707.1 Outer membrane scaffolding protein for murein synthesis, MipA/OmpV family [Arsukibacterium tuosuense]
MKKVTGLLLALSIHALCLPTVSAQEEQAALVPLPSLDDFTRGEDGWSFGLGLGVEYESAYEGSDEFGFEVQPAGAVQWRRGNDIFFFAGEALGWRGLRADTWLFEAIVGFEEGREESDSDDGRLDGLGTTDEGFEFALQARRAFSADWRYWLDGRLVAGENGNLGIFGVGRRFGEQIDGSGSELSVVAVFHDSELANTEFGVDAAQAAASGLDETKLSGGFRSIGVHYNYRHYINDNWRIFGEALYERYSSDIANSPIARNNYEAEVGVGVIYVF